MDISLLLNGNALSKFFADVEKERTQICLIFEKYKDKKTSLDVLSEQVASKHQELHLSVSHIAKKLKTEVQQTQATATKRTGAKASMQPNEGLEKEATSPDSMLEDVLAALEDLLVCFNESGQRSKELCSLLEKVVNGLMDLQKKTFDLQQERMRGLRVLSGGRDIVSLFRFEVFEDVRHHDEDVAEKYASLGAYLDAMHNENSSYQMGRVGERPLYNKFKASVQRLGLTLGEWHLLVELGKQSVLEFHNKFSLDKLETERFPDNYEKYRVPLVKAAKKLIELGAKTEPAEFVV